MALAVADGERIRRGEPDFERLERLLHEGCRKKGFALRGDGTVPYRRLGQAIGKSVTVVYNIVEKHSRPQADVLIALADLFDDPREAWLEAGGFDLATLPSDRGYTTAERDVIRWWNSLTPQGRAEVQRRVDDGRSQSPDEGRGPGPASLGQRTGPLYHSLVLPAWLLLKD